MPRHRLVALGALAVLAVSACDGAEPAAVAPERSAAPAVSGLSGPDGSPLAVTELSLPAPQDAPEAGVEVVRTLPYREGEDPTVTPLAVSPSGEVLVSTFAPGSFDAGSLELLATTPVHLWTGTGLQPLGRTEALGEAHRQVVSGTFAGESPAWHETTGVQIGTTDWRVFASAGDAPVLLARSEQVVPDTERAGLAGHPSLTASGDRVGWETAQAREDGTLRTRLVSVPVSGGELRVEAELATMPAGVAGGWVTLRLEDRDVVGVDADGDAQAPAAGTSIDLVTPGGDARTLVELDGASVLELAAGGGEVVAWTDEADVFVGTTEGPEVQRLLAVPGTSVVPGSLAVCGERAVWAASPADGPSTTYVFDPATGEVSALPTGAGDGTTVCGGPFLAWTQLDDDGGEHVVALARFTAPAGAR
ncbi:hypothetical protein [Georgenia sp. Marseille-Q6866]